MMYFFVLIAILSVGPLDRYPTGLESQWTDIIPLRSTRTDVESILGKPVKQTNGNYTYKAETGEVRVSYSEALCKGSMNGWNVPTDTVLQFTVYPGNGMTVTEDEFEGEKVINYSDLLVLQEKGIAYGLDNAIDHKKGRLVKTLVKYILYMPKESNNNLRCEGFPVYNPFGSIVNPDYAITKEDALDGFDLLTAESKNRSFDFMHYVIVYSGKDMSNCDYDRLFKTYEAHLYKKRGVPPESIRLVQGGKRESFAIEVFSLRTDDPRPVPSPDYPSRDLCKG